jgi:sugar lactone lactonase YvrE
LIVGSNDGVVRSFDPESGASLGAVEVPGGVTTNPVVAGNTLYVVSRKGVLHALR